MKRLITGAVLAVAVLGAACTFAPTSAVGATPEPALVPPKDTFELSFKETAPERLILTENGKTTTYWYVRYTVTNKDKVKHIFTPDFELVTDTGQAIKAYKGVDRSIFGKIKKLHNAEFLKDQFEILGEVAPGEDNAQDGVAIFTGVDTDARSFRFYITGLSNEVQTVKVGTASVTLTKTLEVEYKMPGQQIGIEPAPEFKSRKWLMK